MANTRTLTQDPVRVKRKRIAAGLTQAALGRRAGLTGPTVFQIETGKVAASARSMKALADALGCPVEDLMPELEQASP